jgi:hypothetical protein
LIQQACVFDSDYVLFCVGSVKQVIYCTLVHVPETVRHHWGVTVNGLVAPFVEWAWDALDTKQHRATAPADFSIEHRALLESRYPLWAAMHDKRKSVGGTLPPVRVVRTLVQRVYSRSKPGVVGVDADGAWFSTRQMQLDWGQKVVISKLIGGMTNACTLWRIWKTYKGMQIWPGLDRFRDKCCRETAQTSFAYAVSKQLIIKSNATRVVAETVVEPSREGATTPTKGAMDIVKRGRKALGQRNRLKNANLEAVSAMRESTSIHHKRVSAPSKHCLVCNGRCGMSCEVCGVSLHVNKCKARPNARKNCWDMWHSSSRLTRLHGAEDGSGDE